MPIENPFDIKVYDRDWAFTGFVVDPVFVNMVAYWSDQGYGNFEVDAANPHIAALQADGARVIVNYKGQTILSGPVRSWQGDVFGYGGVTFQVLDWTQFLVRNALAWVDNRKALEPPDLSSTGAGAWLTEPDKAEAGTTKGQYGYIDWPDGSARHGGLKITSSEGAIKYLVDRIFVERYGFPVTIRDDQGRGGDPTDVLPKVRWVALSEVLTPILDFSDLGLRFWHVHGEKGLQFTVLERGTWPQTIRYDSGIIQSGTYTVSAPDVTRVVAGGPSGTDAAGRLVYGDEGKFPLNSQEQRYGYPLENFIDATGYDLNWPDNTDDDHKQAKYFKFVGDDGYVKALYNYLDATISSSRKSGGSSVGLALTLSESKTFYFGGEDGFQLGEEVNFLLANGATVADRLTQVQLVWSRDSGFSVTPIVGEINDDQDKAVVDAIKKLERALRRNAAFK